MEAGHHNGPMQARLTAFLVWLLVGGSAVFWGLRLFAKPLAMPASALPAGEGGSPRADLGRLLGATAAQAAQPEVAASTRLRLLGVVAPRRATAAEAGEGVALIEVDGVARTVRVGAVVDGELHLLRVDARSASLGLAGQAPSQTLQIQPQAAAATGSLPLATPSSMVLGGNPSAAAPDQAAGLPLAPPSPGVPRPSPGSRGGATPQQQ